MEDNKVENEKENGEEKGNEEHKELKGKEQNLLAQNDLSWTMWVWFYIVAVSSGAFHFAEYLGEKLADLFGITSPKYQYVIDEYYRQKREEEEEKEAAEREEEYVQNKKLETLSQLEVGKEQEQRAEP